MLTFKILAASAVVLAGAGIAVPNLTSGDKGSTETTTTIAKVSVDSNGLTPCADIFADDCYGHDGPGSITVEAFITRIAENGFRDPEVLIEINGLQGHRNDMVSKDIMYTVKKEKTTDS